MERGGPFANAFWRRVVDMTPLQKALGAVVLHTIFILLGLRGSYSAAHIFVLDVFDFQLNHDGLTEMLYADFFLRHQ